MTSHARPGDFRVDSATVFRIAVPMTLAFLSTPLLGAVDTGVVGQLGDAALVGGIAVGALVFDFLFSTFNFLRSGTTGLTAQALGAGDEREMAASLARALVVAAVSGLAMIALAGPILAASLAFVDPSDAVAAATATYFGIRILSAPFALANYAVLGWVLGLGRSGLGLALQTLLNGVNIAGSIGLGLGAGWGIAGVAWGTVIGEVVTAVVGLVVCVGIGRHGFHRIRGAVFERAAFLRMLAVNRDIMIRSFALLFAFAAFTRAGARFGDTVLAANAVLMNFFMIGGYFLDGLANAAEQLAGRAVGARTRAAFDAAVRLTVAWGFAFSAVVAVVLFVAGGPVIDVMTTSPEVRAAAAAFLPWAALTPLAGVLAFEMDGVYIGATWSREMRNMMLVSLAIFLAVLWAATPVLGNHGLWLALLVFLGARGLTLAARVPALATRTFAEETR
ncbi:MATE family efflux transporter [Oharaeibacter diazotrophicus]|uniref:Putative MATE family efflux protein n=1 Tax=Oharaeibacter diazotrophicus TaxID=1920512 RepID=A0A4R6RA78_9HYPH|nr:MATE family efflux transporter [Oharaeibacter diazotrophicus]TDP82546.1 putative MATE family efflux protein [Oharaeibacter diazotrophicus]BBE72690.1 DNA-damage-inducible protein F [Pleomorphomonas sp. SM30]GLS76725.1 MATE family efflux transporter [Oharaeibacter diazotrophicus]